jgi:hypothetical protein
MSTSTAGSPLRGGVPVPSTVWQDREVEQGCGEHPGVSSADTPGATNPGGAP